jgi:hypothetical protein
MCLGLLPLSAATAGDKGKIPYFENETFESNFRKGVQESVTLRDGRVVELHADYTWDWAQVKKAPPRDGDGGSPPANPPAALPGTAAQAVEVWDTTFDLGEVDDVKAVRLFIHYKNNTPKKVVGVTIAVKITNSFGKALYAFSKDDEVTLQPMEQLKNDAYFAWKYNPSSDGDSPYNLMWEAARNESGKVSVKVQKVVFEDGSVLTNDKRNKNQ